MSKVTKQELLNFIYEHVDWDSIYEEPRFGQSFGQSREEYGFTKELISIYVDRYLDTFKQEILDIIFKHTKNRKEFKLWEQEIINLCKASRRS